MKKRMVLTCGALLSGLWLTAAVAGEGGSAAPPAQGQEQEVQGQAGVVPQAQADYVKKREEAKQRRDEALKVRAEAVQAGQ